MQEDTLSLSHTYIFFDVQRLGGLHRRLGGVRRGLWNPAVTLTYRIRYVAVTYTHTQRTRTYTHRFPFFTHREGESATVKPVSWGGWPVTSVGRGAQPSRWDSESDLLETCQRLSCSSWWDVAAGDASVWRRSEPLSLDSESSDDDAWVTAAFTRASVFGSAGRRWSWSARERLVADRVCTPPRSVSDCNLHTCSYKNKMEQLG